MDDLLTIGAFAKRCGLASSALRFYDECGLLRPVVTDDTTGYRYYDADQLDTAVLVRRLRAMDMPVDQVRAFLDTDPAERRSLLDAHITAAEQRLHRVRQAAEDVAASLDTPSLTGTVACLVSGPTLAAALRQVIFAAAAAPVAGRPELTGVLLEVKDDTLRLVATDRHRLAIRDVIPDRGTVTHPFHVLVTADRLGELLPRLRTVDRCALSQTPGGGAQLDLDGATVSLDPVPGEFPDYESILLGAPTGHHCVVDRRALGVALDRLDGSPVTMSFTSSGLQIGSPTVRSAIPARWNGPELTVTINPAFVADAVAAHIGPDVAIEAADELRPVTFRSADDGTLSVLVMPIRTER